MEAAAAHRKLGIEAKRAGDHAAALRHFMDALSTSPRNAAIAIDAVNAHRALGHLDLAEAMATEVLGWRPGFPAALHALGLVARERGDNVTALARIEEAHAAAPSNVGILRDLAAEHERAGHFADAEAAFLKLTEIDGGKMLGNRGLARLARRCGNYHEAIAYLGIACTIDPDNRRLRVERIEAFRAAGQMEEARQACLELQALEPDAPDWRYQLVLVARAQQDGAEVLAGLRALHHDHKGYRNTEYELGSELLAQGHLAEAKQIFAGLAETEAGRVNGWAGLAQLARLEDDGETEVVLRRRIAAADPANFPNWSDLARRALVLEGQKAAGAVLADCMAKNAGDPRLLLALAGLARQLWEPECAAQALQEAEMAALNRSDFSVRLASEAKNQGRLEQAQRLCEAALAQAPKDAEARLLLAQIDRRAERNQESLNALIELHQEDPERRDIALELLRALGDAQESGAILSVFPSLEALASKDITVAEALVALLGESGLQEIIPACADRWVKNADPYHRHRLLGEAAIAAGDAPAAKSHFETALAKKPDDTDVIMRLASLAARLKNFRQANILLASIKSGSPGTDASVELSIARNLFKLGEFRDAIDRMERQNSRPCATPQTLLAHAGFLQRRGRMAEALQLLKEAEWRYRGSAPVLFHSIQTNLRAGHLDEVTRLLERARAQETLPPGTLRIFDAALALEHRHVTKARTILESYAPDKSIETEHARLLSFCCILSYDLDAARAAIAANVHAKRHDKRLRRQSLNISKSLIGQLLDEYRIDAAVSRRLAELFQQESGDNLPTIVAMVRDNPQSTAAALALLLRLRQFGGFAPQSPATGSTQIPRVITQFWNAPEPPEDVQELMSSWQRYHPTWQYERYDMGRAVHYLREHHPAKVAGAFQKATNHAARADIFRLAILSRKGGFYVDADDRCQLPLDNLSQSGYALIGYQENFASLANNFLGATPGHPVILRALEDGVEAVLRGDADMPWLASGPGLVSRSLASWLATDPEEIDRKLRGVYILERDQYAQYCTYHCFAAYKQTSSHWSNNLFE